MNEISDSIKKNLKGPVKQTYQQIRVPEDRSSFPQNPHGECAEITTGMLSSDHHIHDMVHTNACIHIQEEGGREGRKERETKKHRGDRNSLYFHPTVDAGRLQHKENGQILIRHQTSDTLIWGISTYRIQW